MTVYLVSRLLKLDSGQEISVSVKCFQHEADATRMARDLQKGMAPILNHRIVRMSGSSMTTGEAEDIGLPVGSYLADLGVLGFKHVVTPVDVATSSLVQTEGPALILPH